MGARLTPAQGSAGVSWTDIGISGAPDTDVNGIYSLLTVHGSSEYTLAVTDASAAVGTAAAATWIVALPDEYNADGTQQILFRMEFIDSAASQSSAGYWIGMSIADTAGVMTAGGMSLGGCLYYNTSRLGAPVERGLFGAICGLAGTVWQTTITPRAGTPATGLGDALIRGSETAVPPSSTAVSDTSAIAGTVKIIVTCGCQTAGVKGVVSLRAKLQYAIVDFPS